MVSTNMGDIPIEDYRDIMARQYGFEDYNDMRTEGYLFGNEYDKEWSDE